MRPEGARGSGRRRRSKFDPYSWANSTPSRRTNVLLLGVSYPCVKSQIKAANLSSSVKLLHPLASVEQTVELVRRNVLTQMDGRDLARCLAVEASNLTHTYTVSMEHGALYGPRHLTANFNRHSICREMKKAWSPKIKFRQIILDYFWIPSGSWAMTHWTRTFFTKTLPSFVTENMLDTSNGEGTVYLPFCVHCMAQVVAAKDALLKHYDISFLYQHELSENVLWQATSTINAHTMQVWLGKDIKQEEIYCTFRLKDVLNGVMENAYVRKEDLLKVLRGIENFDKVRMIKMQVKESARSRGTFLGLKKKTSRGIYELSAMKKNQKQNKTPTEQSYEIQKSIETSHCLEPSGKALVRADISRSEKDQLAIHKQIKNTIIQNDKGLNSSHTNKKNAPLNKPKRRRSRPKMKVKEKFPTKNAGTKRKIDDVVNNVTGSEQSSIQSNKRKKPPQNKFENEVGTITESTDCSLQSYDLGTKSINPITRRRSPSRISPKTKVEKQFFVDEWFPTLSFVPKKRMKRPRIWPGQISIDLDVTRTVYEKKLLEWNGISSRVTEKLRKITKAARFDPEKSTTISWYNRGNCSNDLTFKKNSPHCILKETINSTKTPQNTYRVDMRRNEKMDPSLKITSNNDTLQSSVQDSHIVQQTHEESKISLPLPTNNGKSDKNVFINDIHTTAATKTKPENALKFREAAMLLLDIKRGIKSTQPKNSNSKQSSSRDPHCKIKKLKRKNKIQQNIGNAKESSNENSTFQPIIVNLEGSGKNSNIDTKRKNNRNEVESQANRSKKPEGTIAFSTKNKKSITQRIKDVKVNDCNLPEQGKNKPVHKNCSNMHNITKISQENSVSGKIIENPQPSEARSCLTQDATSNLNRELVPQNKFTTLTPLKKTSSDTEFLSKLGLHGTGTKIGPAIKDKNLTLTENCNVKKFPTPTLNPDLKANQYKSPIRYKRKKVQTKDEHAGTKKDDQIQDGIRARKNLPTNRQESKTIKKAEKLIHERKKEKKSSNLKIDTSLTLNSNECLTEALQQEGREKKKTHCRKRSLNAIYPDLDMPGRFEFNRALSSSNSNPRVQDNKNALELLKEDKQPCLKKKQNGCSDKPPKIGKTNGKSNHVRGGIQNFNAGIEIIIKSTTPLTPLGANSFPDGKQMNSEKTSKIQFASKRNATTAPNSNHTSISTLTHKKRKTEQSPLTEQLSNKFVNWSNINQSILSPPVPRDFIQLPGIVNEVIKPSYYPTMQIPPILSQPLLTFPHSFNQLKGPLLENKVEFPLAAHFGTPDCTSPRIANMLSPRNNNFKLSSIYQAGHETLLGCPSPSVMNAQLQFLGNCVDNQPRNHKRFF